MIGSHLIYWISRLFTLYTFIECKWQSYKQFVNSTGIDEMIFPYELTYKFPHVYLLYV